MRPIAGLIIIAVLAGGGYVGYKWFVLGEDVTIEKPDINLEDMKPDVSPWTKAESAFNLLQYETAGPYYEQVVKEDPDPKHVERAHFRYARCLREIKDYPAALQAYKTALQKYPQSDDAAKAKKAISELELLGK